MGTVRAHRPRSKRGDGGALRGEILAAANELIAEGGGNADISLRAIARRTGVTPMMLYRHFTNLDEILDEIQRDHYRSLVQALQRAMSAADDELDAFAIAFTEYGLSHPGHFRLMFAIPLNPDREISPDKPLLGQPALELLVTTVNDHLSQHHQTRDPWRAAIYLWTALHGIVHLRLSVGMRGRYAWPPLEDQIADALEPLRSGRRE